MGEADDPALTADVPSGVPPADDAEADAEYQRLMREELVASRLAGIATVDAALQMPDPSTRRRWSRSMQAINGLRLVLGTMLDVGEDARPRRHRRRRSAGRRAPPLQLLELVARLGRAGARRAGYAAGNMKHPTVPSPAYTPTLGPMR